MCFLCAVSTGNAVGPGPWPRKFLAVCQPFSVQRADELLCNETEG